MDATAMLMALLTHPLQVMLAVVVLAHALRSAFSGLAEGRQTEPNRARTKAHRAAA